MGAGDCWIRAFSTEGDSLWTFSSSFPDFYYRSAASSGTDLLACGYSATQGLAAITRLDTSGNLVWERQYPDCIFGTLENCSDGGFLLSGRSPFPGDDYSATLMKVDSQGWWGGTGTGPGTVPDVSLMRIFPNPSSNEISISFSLETGGECHISIFDVSGRELIRQSGSLQRGSHSLDLDDLASGVYICRITAGRESQSSIFSVVR
jgi:hypothetical protein